MDRCGSPLWPRLGALLLLLTSAQVAVASGQFELQVNSFQNLYGELVDGRCCTGRRSGPDGRCVAPCRTFFRACVQQYAARHSSLAPRSPCVLGNASTLVLGGNELKAHGTVAYGDSSTRIAVPFKFAWPRSFTLVLEAWHQKNASTAGQPSAGAPEGSGLIMQTTHPGMVLPGVMWQNLHGHGPSMVVQYRIRVTCDENYFGSNCTRLCKPQNDYFGHYTCDTQGNKICREGWTGAGCKNAICRQGCSMEHGSCDVPGECKCSYGWQGTYCDRCTTYPGCVHGTCQKPWDCNCNVNWGGMMCDKDLNYCGTRNLCLNGGTCINTQPDDYMCRCPDGYSGKTCKIVAVEKACLSSPCANGGSCTDTPQGFECSCPSSWTGPACTQDVDDCVSAPCAHGGTCQDTPDGFHCFCPSQWSGLTCQVDVDECKTNPCVHARFCKNLFGSYYCSCLPGWFGQDCDIGESACHGYCLGGGTCKLSERGPECICPEGFLGVHCEIKPNACASLQCPHGMHCLIQSDTLPHCVCPPDSEHRCQEVYPCEPNPCRNGGLCSPLGGDYVCRCSDDYEGKNCSVPHDRCQSTSCKVIDSCTLVIPSRNGPVTIVSSPVCGQHGHCVSLPGANFSCVCDLGFTGSRCHENINDCAGKNCLNGATCVDGVNSFQCICPDGWNGDFCQNDVDDCIPNPCQHGGACADLVNDFNCTCQGGWKGRTCHSRTSHCDASTCNNGGTCFEEGASFECLCPPGWNGVTCSATQNNSCTPSPCENGATCIGAGDSSFICVCSEGWEGPTCSNNIDDCSSRPCSNGGRCIDGVNWYMCECAPGFAGPDCRININECQSSPCMSGGTCIDKINGYTCVCPPGKTGLNCMHDVELERTCRSEGRNRSHSSTWMEDCNICQCSDGFKNCTKVWCGEKPCILSQQVGFGNSGCAAGHSCIPELPETCLMEPCHHIGRCLPSTAQPPTVCLPGIREQPFPCTRIELVFERAHVLTGTTVELVCSDLRNTMEIRGLAWSHHIYITCTLGKYDVSQAHVDVTISSDAGAARIDLITVVESRVLDAVWRLKLGGSKHMMAVTNVHTHNETPGQLVFILSVALALALLLLLVVVFMWYLRRRRIAKARAASPHNSPRHNNAGPHPPTCFIYNPIPRHGQDRPMLEANKELDNKLLGSGDDRRTRNLELTEFCVGKQSLLEPFGKETGSIPPPFFGKDALSPGEMEPLRTNLKCSVHSIEVDV